MDEPVALRTSIEVAERIRVSYRQLDHWVRRGYLPIRDLRPGTGNRRIWSEPEIQRAEAFALMVHAGIRPAFASDAMDSLAIGEDGFVLWAGPLTITGRFTA